MDYKNKIPLIKVRNLSKQFKIRGGKLNVLNNLNIDIYKGETLGLVGESGCGKSTAGRTILKFYDDDITGEVFYKDKNIFKFSKTELRELRKDMQLIFQDPYASLDTCMTVKNIIEEPLLIHNTHTSKERNKKIDEMLQLVGLKLEDKNRFPHEFSGGQRQRICIARALVISPKFIVCDEPTASLDVSIQAQIINLLIDLQKKFNCTYLFIAHDLSIVKYISNRILVMYLGNMVELAENVALSSNSLHPYTKVLFSAALLPMPENGDKGFTLETEPQDALNLSGGCVFRTRCPEAMDICSKKFPVWKEVEKEHFVACHLYK